MAHPTPRPCLDCNTPTLLKPPRCASCRSRDYRARETLRGNRHQRGYGTQHDKRKAELEHSKPDACPLCGGPPPYHLDHLYPGPQGRQGPVRWICANCNLRKKDKPILPNK